MPHYQCEQEYVSFRHKECLGKCTETSDQMIKKHTNKHSSTEAFSVQLVFRESICWRNGTLRYTASTHYLSLKHPLPTFAALNLWGTIYRNSMQLQRSHPWTIHVPTEKSFNLAWSRHSIHPPTSKHDASSCTKFLWSKPYIKPRPR